MTREEAIQELKELNTILKSWSGFTEYPQALYIAIDMAIEALSADSNCNNCEEYGSYKCTRCDGEIYYKALPSAEAPYMFSKAYVEQLRFERDYLQDVVNDQWIPCSERLPKEKQEVYVTVYFTEGDTGRAYGYMDGFGRWHLYSTVEGILNSGYEVTAWMPLPKPYKGCDDE